MATNLLLVGTATDGPTNRCIAATSFDALSKMFGGNRTERFSLSATATGVVLSYETLDGVREKETRALYAPVLEGRSLTFGAVGGTGMVLDCVYTPYLGKPDLLAAAAHLFEGGAAQVSVCRVGGARASLETGGWRFEARHRGLRYNQVTVVGTASGIVVSGLEPDYPTRTFTGVAERVQARINEEARLGVCPVYAPSAPGDLATFTGTLSGGLDGSVDSASFQSFIDAGAMPAQVSHVLVLGNFDAAMMDAASTHLADPATQPRLFVGASPYTLAPVAFLGATAARAAIATAYGTPVEEGFESFVASGSLSVCGLSLAGEYAAPALGGRARAGTKALLLTPTGSGRAVFTAPSGYRIRSFGVWTPWSFQPVLEAYDGTDAYSKVNGLTGVASGLFHFAGVGLERGATSIAVSSASSASGFCVDDVCALLARDPGGNLEEVFASVRLLPKRSQFVTLFLGDVDVPVRGTLRRRHAAEAAAEAMAKTDWLPTNKSTRARYLRPVLTEDECGLAAVNGIVPVARFIRSGIAPYRGVASDGSTSLRFSSKAAEICSEANQVLLKKLGRPLQQGAQPTIADEIFGRLSGVSGATVESVSVDLEGDTLRVLVDGYVGSEILKISFAARGA